MASVSKIEFKANQNNNWLPSNYSPNASQEQNNNNNSQRQIETAKTVAYVSAGVALASLGVGIALISKGKSNKVADDVSKLRNEMTKFGDDVSKFSDDINKLKTEIAEGINEKIDETINPLKDEIKRINDTLRNLATRDELTAKGNELHERITGLGNWQDGQINNLKNTTEGQIAGLNRLQNTSPNSSAANFLTENVNINGQNLRLATILNDISSWYIKSEFEKELHAESIKGIFGLRKPLDAIPKNPYIRIVSVELKPFSTTGGMAVIPKELPEELPKIINKHNHPVFVLDTPLYEGRVGIENGEEVTWRLVKNKGLGTYTYQKYLGGKLNSTFPVEKMDEMAVNIVGEEAQNVRLFRLNMDGTKVPFSEVERLFDENYLKTIDKKLEQLSGNPKTATFETLNYKIVRDEHGKYFIPKLKINLWDNKKFNLDIPLGNDAGIYSESGISSGLQERAIYFSKYIYEHTVKMKDTYLDGAIKDTNGKILLKADAFINNDWQTGPLDAMIRLSTIAKKYYGKLTADVADKIKEMPILTLIHNAKPQGNIWFEKEKFLNIMFDELAAKIVPNAWAPNLSEMYDYKMPGHLLNSLFTNEDINPMHMVATHSDVLDIVSEGYKKEISTNDFFGRGLTHIYYLRSKAEALQNPEEYIKKIRMLAERNEINLEGITDAQILRPTIRGRNNGLNKINNILTQEEINTHKNLSKEEFKEFGFENLRAYKEDMTPKEALEWAKHNKQLALNYLIKAVDEAKGYEKSGRLNTWLGDMTNLDGVNVNTPVFRTAGRIDPQKGYELYINAIRYYVEHLHQEGDEIPAFMIQGQVQEGYGKFVVDLVKNLKNELAAKGHKKFADRIVFLDRGDYFKYTISRLTGDHPDMSSIFEPKGLTHIEDMNKCFGIPVVNDTGGTMAGLEDGVNAFAVKYEPNPPDGSRPEDYIENIKNFAHGFRRAFDVHKDELKHANMTKESQKIDFSWTSEGGTAFEYADDLAEFNLIPKIER